jgi:hypothetical protein
MRGRQYGNRKMGPGAGSLAGRLAEAAAEACRTRPRCGPLAQPTDLTPRLTPGVAPRPPRSVPAPQPQPLPRALTDAWERIGPAEHDAVLGLALSLARPALAPPRVLRIRRDVDPLVRTVRAVLTHAARRSRLNLKGTPSCA